MSAAFTVRLDETTLGALDQLAEKTERSRNWLVAKAKFEDYLALNAWQVADRGRDRCRRQRRLRQRLSVGSRAEEIRGPGIKLRWMTPALRDLETIGDYIAS